MYDIICVTNSVNVSRLFMCLIALKKRQMDAFSLLIFQRKTKITVGRPTRTVYRVSFSWVTADDEDARGNGD